MRSSSSMRQQREGFAAEYPGPNRMRHTKNNTHGHAEDTKNNTHGHARPCGIHEKQYPRPYEAHKKHPKIYEKINIPCVRTRTQGIFILGYLENVRIFPALGKSACFRELGECPKMPGRAPHLQPISSLL